VSISMVAKEEELPRFPISEALRFLGPLADWSLYSVTNKSPISCFLWGINLF
jgi:hypothetical protein